MLAAWFFLCAKRAILVADAWKKVLSAAVIRNLQEAFHIQSPSVSSCHSFTPGLSLRLYPSMELIIILRLILLRRSSPLCVSALFHYIVKKTHGCWQQLKHSCRFILHPFFANTVIKRSSIFSVSVRPALWENSAEIKLVACYLFIFYFSQMDEGTPPEPDGTFVDYQTTMVKFSKAIAITAQEMVNSPSLRSAPDALSCLS